MSPQITDCVKTTEKRDLNTSIDVIIAKTTFLENYQGPTAVIIWNNDLLISTINYDCKYKTSIELFIDSFSCILFKMTYYSKIFSFED